MDPLLLFKALSDATRLRCIVLLATNGELCVCELAYALELQQPKISHHLGMGCKQAEIVPSVDHGFSALNLTSPDDFSQVLETVETQAKRLIETT